MDLEEQEHNWFLILERIILLCFTEFWNGTSWTEVADLATGR